MKPAFLLAMFALAACTSVVAAPTGPVGFGQVTAVENVQARPLALLEDSRCPATVHCVWAGQVRIRADILTRTGREVRDMTLGKPIAAGGGALTLVDAEPPRLTPGTTEPRQYRFTFDFKR